MYPLTSVVCIEIHCIIIIIKLTSYREARDIEIIHITKIG